MGSEDFYFVGVDLGKTGYICFLKDKDSYEFTPMPLKKTPSGKMEYCDIQTTNLFEDKIILNVVFENVSLPPEFRNTQAIKNLAEMQGFFTGLCRGKKIPFNCVGASRWQNKMTTRIDGNTKKRAIAAAKKINPDINLKRNDRCRVDDHNIADSYLMALYAEYLFFEPLYNMMLPKGKLEEEKQKQIERHLLSSRVQTYSIEDLLTS